MPAQLTSPTHTAYRRRKSPRSPNYGTETPRPAFSVEEISLLAVRFLHLITWQTQIMTTCTATANPNIALAKQNAENSAFFNRIRFLYSAYSQLPTVHSDEKTDPQTYHPLR